MSSLSSSIQKGCLDCSRRSPCMKWLWLLLGRFVGKCYLRLKGCHPIEDRSVCHWSASPSALGIQCTISLMRSLEVLLVLDHRVYRPSHLCPSCLGVQAEETVDRHSLQQQPAEAGGGSQPQRQGRELESLLVSWFWRSTAD